MGLLEWGITAKTSDREFEEFVPPCKVLTDAHVVRPCQDLIRSRDMIRETDQIINSLVPVLMIGLGVVAKRRKSTIFRLNFLWIHFENKSRDRSGACGDNSLC